MPDSAFVCRFGKTLSPVSGAYLATLDAVLCVSPKAMSTGAAVVEISTNGGAEFTDDGVEFRYRSPASASTLFPLSGPDVGGTQIGIIGKHFQDSAFSEIQWSL